MQSPTDAALTELASEVPEPFRAYFEYHRRRYGFLAEVVAAMPVRDGSRRITVIGPGFEVPLFARLALGDIRTIGLGETGLRDGREHVEFDLRWLLEGCSVPAVRPADIVVMCEVIEHLPFPPEIALRAVKVLAQAGGRIIVQTPNAVRLDARWKILRGRQPFERLRHEPDNPCHYREYTVAEFTEIATASGLEIEGITTHNYFGGGGTHQTMHRGYEALERFVPMSMREGITAILVAP